MNKTEYKNLCLHGTCVEWAEVGDRQHGDRSGDELWGKARGRGSGTEQVAGLGKGMTGRVDGQPAGWGETLVPHAPDEGVISEIPRDLPQFSLKNNSVENGQRTRIVIFQRTRRHGQRARGKASPPTMGGMQITAPSGWLSPPRRGNTNQRGRGEQGPLTPRSPRGAQHAGSAKNKQNRLAAPQPPLRGVYRKEHVREGHLSARASAGRAWPTCLWMSG